jgi:signal transduction histidine kinase/ligand-binding sensor domain-containing protein
VKFARRWLSCTGALLLAILPPTAAARVDPDPIPHARYLVKNWSTVDGLPDTTVRSIVEGHDGYLWLGTAGGISRFDGIRFRNFTTGNTPALISDNVFDLAEDGEGRLWIATSHGLAVREAGVFRWVDLGEVGESPRAPVFSLGIDDEGRAWANAQRSVLRHDGTRFQKVPFDSEALHFKVDPSGKVWVGSAKGVHRWNGTRFEPVPGTFAMDVMEVDARGRVWMLTFPNSLSLWEDGVVRRLPSPGPGWFQAVVALPSGDVWVGARVGSESVRYRGEAVHRVDASDGLYGARPIGYCEDRGGNLWMGLNRGGLFRLREPRLTLYRAGPDLPSGAVVTVAADAGGTIHAGLMGAGILALDGQRFQPRLLGDPRTPQFLTTSLLPHTNGGLWVGTQFGGLRRWDQGGLSEPLGGSFGTRVLFTDRRGRLWRGSLSAGLECHDPATGIHTFTAASHGLSSDAITALAEGQADAIWVGTEHGLNLLSKTGVSRFGLADGLGHEWIRSLCTDGSGRLWVGTAGGGLSVWKDGRFVTLGVANGLPSGRVDLILDDTRGNLWVGTPSGLTRIPLADLGDFVAGKLRVVHGTTFGAEDGLPVPQFGTGFHPAALVDPSGKLWFCSDSGIVMLDPARLPAPAPAPRVHIEEVWVDGVRQAGNLAREGVTVPSGTDRLEILYTGLEFSAPDRVRFRYRLEPYDEDWVDAQEQRTARYSKLRPGSYRFRVDAANNDGTWSAPIAGLPVVVQPSFWQSRWFGGGAGLLFAALLVAVYRIRARETARRRAAEESFTRQLIESQERERSRIADELHDSLGHGLLVIKNRASLAVSQPSDPTRLVQHLREVSTMATEAIREVRSIARNLRPFQLDELGLTKSISSVVRNLADSSDIEFHVSLDPVDDALEPETRINFYRIVQECLNNVVKHSQARSATVGLRWNDHSLRLTVSDDGCGFRTPEPALLATAGFGLGNIAQRARSLGGQVTFESEPGRGTRVIVEVRTRLARPTNLSSSQTQTFRKASV